MKALKDLLSKSCNIKWSFLFCPYNWTYGIKELSGGWKNYQGGINNTCHSRHIETNHRFIYSILEDAENHFYFPNVATSVSGTLREVLDNECTTKNKIPLK